MRTSCSAVNANTMLLAVLPLAIILAALARTSSNKHGNDSRLAREFVRHCLHILTAAGAQDNPYLYLKTHFSSRQQPRPNHSNVSPYHLAGLGDFAWKDSGVPPPDHFASQASYSASLLPLGSGAAPKVPGGAPTCQVDRDRV